MAPSLRARQPQSTSNINDNNDDSTNKVNAHPPPVPTRARASPSVSRNNNSDKAPATQVISYHQREKSASAIANREVESQKAEFESKRATLKCAKCRCVGKHTLNGTSATNSIIIKCTVCNSKVSGKNLLDFLNQSAPTSTDSQSENGSPLPTTPPTDTAYNKIEISNPSLRSSDIVNVPPVEPSEPPKALSNNIDFSALTTVTNS